MISASTFDFSIVNLYYHISPEGADHPLAEMPATDFLTRDIVSGMLKLAGETVQAHGFELPASFFGTTLCKLCSTKLLFLAQYNVLLDLSLANLLFQIEKHDDHVHLGYKIKELRYVEVPSEDAEKVILNDWQTFISTTVTPAIEAISEAAGVKPAMIWQQFGGEVGMLRDFVQKNETRAHVLEAFDRNFLLMSESIPADCFNLRRNPFKHTIRYTDSPYQPGDNLVMRSSCCMYDCRDNGGKCYVCPRLRPEEREERRLKIQAAL